MNSGSSKVPAKTETVTTQIPDWLRPSVQDTVARASVVGQRPYQAYGGKRVADFDPAYGDIGDEIGQTQGQVDRYNNMGEGQLQRAGDALGGGSRYDPRLVNVGEWDAAQFQKYGNPFQVGVLDREADFLHEQFQRQQADMRLRRGASGAYGDYSSAVEDALARQNHDRYVGDRYASGLRDNYSQALGAFESARGARLQGDNMEIGDRQFGAEFNARRDDTRYDQRLGLADAYGRLGEARLRQGGELNQQRSDLASMRMGHEQALIDAKYDDHVKQQTWDQEQINWLTGVLYGVPVSQQDRYQTSYSSPLAQGLGAVTSAAGLYRGLKS